MSHPPEQAIACDLTGALFKGQNCSDWESVGRSQSPYVVVGGLRIAVDLGVTGRIIDRFDKESFGESPLSCSPL